MDSQTIEGLFQRVEIKSASWKIYFTPVADPPSGGLDDTNILIK